MKKFELGQLVVTSAVDELMKTDHGFSVFVRFSLGRFMNGNWGTLCPEDKANSDRAIIDNQMIMGAYKHGDTEIWIITESDRCTTTILFPHER